MLSPNIMYEFFGTALLVYSYNIGFENLRGFAYFIGWILSYHISGAEFNPAISIASFIVKRDWTKGMTLLLTIVGQIFGAFFGLFLVYILMKD